MGEVYRADDLSLGQQVALKFLPEAATDEEVLERFRNEVRTARRISHPNVCRVFDIGQTADQVFFSMEYIDGEDLGSLLGASAACRATRHPRLPQVCAGLAAAHNKGVLHRDSSRPMSCSMAAARSSSWTSAWRDWPMKSGICRSGTPAYMAPEQLAGDDVTQRSDIYSLGLVLYEVFTGKPAFDGRTLEEIVRFRSDRAPSRPSSLVKDLDPTVERIILRCLETDPANRPDSALTVAAALPGGDPLAAALAAGETPSPQLVAAAGEKAGLSIAASLTWVAAAMLGLVVFYALGVSISGIRRMDLPYSQEVLAQKARDLVQQLGYPSQTVDSADGFDYDSDFVEYLEGKNTPAQDWNKVLKGPPALLRYWLRFSPKELVAEEPKDNLLVPGIVDRSDPPPIISGMVEIVLDPRGKLNPTGSDTA